jgi:hypothetical protein
MIHPNLIVKKFTFVFWHFVYSATSSNVHLAQLTLSPIHNHKTKYENTFFKNHYGTHHSQKFMQFFQNVTMWLKTFKYTCPKRRIFFFLGLKIWTNLKKKYEKRILHHFFFKKKVIRFTKKFKIMLRHFLIGFALGTIFQMFKWVPTTCHHLRWDPFGFLITNVM